MPKDTTPRPRYGHTRAELVARLAALRKVIATKKLARTTDEQLAAAAASAATADATGQEYEAWAPLRAEVSKARRMAYAPKTMDGMASLAARYIAFMARKHLPAFPARRLAIAAFVIELCRINNNAISAVNWASTLHAWATLMHNQRPPSPADWTYYKQVFKGAGNLYGCRSKKSPGITDNIMRQVWERVRPSPHRNRRLWAIWVQLVVAQSIMARPGSHTGADCPRVRDVKFRPRMGATPAHAELMVKRTKRNRRLGIDTPQPAWAMELQERPMDPVHLLRMYITVFKLQHRQAWALFGPIDKHGNRMPQPHTNAQFNAGLRLLMRAADLEFAPTGVAYTARSARSGGRVSLRTAGTDAVVSNIMGGWNANSKVGDDYYFLATPEILQGVRRAH